MEAPPLRVILAFMLVKTHEDLIVFQRSIDAAVLVFEACRGLPSHERFGLVDQWLRCSRSVCANLAEVWRKRYYRSHFLSKLSDVEAEAAECQVWAILAWKYGYISEETSLLIRKAYDEVLSLAVSMARNADQWTYNRKAHT